MAAQEPQGLSEELVAVAAADAIADLRLVVSAAGIHQRPEFLRVPGRASRGFSDQGVRLAGKPFRFLHTAAAFEHVRDEGGHDPPLLSVVKVRPTPPVLLHLEVDPQLEQEGDARILIPAEPRDPGVGGVLQHLVGRPGLAAE